MGRLEPLLCLTPLLRGCGGKKRKGAERLEVRTVGLLLVGNWQPVLVPVGASDLRHSAGSGAGTAGLSRLSTQGSSRQPGQWRDRCWCPQGAWLPGRAGR